MDFVLKSAARSDRRSGALVLPYNVARYKNPCKQTLPIPIRNIRFDGGIVAGMLSTRDLILLCIVFARKAARMGVIALLMTLPHFGRKRGCYRWSVLIHISMVLDFI